SERPGGTLLTRFPQAIAAGIFAYYQRVYTAGAPDIHEVNYQADGLDNFFRLAARRSGEWLVVSFTDTSDQDRSAVEEALRESQAAEQAAHAVAEQQRQRFREVLTQVPAYIAVYQGPDHIYQFVNPAYQSLFPHRSFLGKPFREGTPESVELGVVALFDQVYQTGEPVYLREIEGWFDFHGDGQPVQVFLNISLHPLRNVQGHLDGVLDFTYDVSEQVRARQQVEQLNQELETRVLARTHEVEAARATTERQRRQWEELFRTAPAGICIFDGPEWVYQFVNPGYQAMFPGRALLGKPLLEALPELVGQPLVDILHRVYDTGEPFEESEVLVPLARTEGGPIEDIYFDLTYQARYNEAGQIDGFITYAYDVTEQVRARQAREAQQGELQRIFEQAPTIISVLRGSQYLVELANDQQLAAWGRPRAQVLGRPLFEALPELATQDFEQPLRQVLATGQPYVATDAPARVGPPEQSQEAFFSFVFTPLREADARVSGVIIVATDTTAQVRARRQADTIQAALLGAAQRQVQQREELFQVFEQAPAAIVLLRGPEHRIEYVNPAYQQFFPGVSLRGRLMVDAHPGVAANNILARLDRVYQTGEPYVGEEQPVALALTPGQPSQTRYFNFVYQPYREAGRIVGVSIFAYDVTGPALARRRAAEQDRQFRELYEQAPMAVTILRGPDFVVELANPAILRIWGQTAEQVLGRPRLELIPETSRPSMRAVLEKPYRTGQTHHVQEFPVVLGRSHTGQPDQGYFNFIYQPLLDEHGETVALTCVGIEVTEQVQARRQLEQLNQELEARVQARTQEVREAQAATERERALLQALLTQAPVAISLFTGEEMRIAAANEMMATIWGYTPAQVLGKPFMEGVPELRGQGFDDLLRQVLTTRVPITGTETPAVMLRDGALKTTYYNFVYQPLYDAEGEVLGVIDVAVEVTEQVESRRALEQLNQQLEARVRERTRELSEQQALLSHILGQVPAAIATLSGPEHRYTFFNELYQELAAGRAALGRTVAEVFPEVVEQGFISLLDQVYLTGEPFVGTDMPAQLYDARLASNRQYYIDFIYQPLFDQHHRVQGILAFILDVTDRALARQQAEKSQLEVQVLNEEMAAINEELRAT
ncbi:MAG: PAS domain S-box protein, partial [Hymenobacter sp.]